MECWSVGAVQQHSNTPTLQHSMQPSDLVRFRHFVALPALVAEESVGFVRTVADDFAARGYVAIAPDLLTRRGGTTTADSVKSGRSVTMGSDGTWMAAIQPKRGRIIISYEV